MSGIRKIGKINLPNLEPKKIEGAAPVCRLVNPADLYVEGKYQRDLAENSIKLIRTLVREWNWAHMKPPICVKDGDKLYVVDGQHTAIAAAAHPDIKQIPVMIVKADQIEDRARAFVVHNTAQIRVTTMQIFFSELAAGDEIAKIVDQACSKAKVKVLRCPPAHGVFRLGETVAVVSLKGIAKNKGLPGLVRILKVLVDAGRAPIKKTETAAVFRSSMESNSEMPSLITILRPSSVPRLLTNGRH
jgi:hypothetical protein